MTLLMAVANIIQHFAIQVISQIDYYILQLLLSPLVYHRRLHLPPSLYNSFTTLLSLRCAVQLFSIHVFLKSSPRTLRA